MDELKLLEAYTRLKGIKDNIPNTGPLTETYVTEYHDVLKILMDITGFDLSGFSIPQSEVQPRVTMSNVYTGEKLYSPEKYCPKPLFSMKVDAVLTFFEMQIPESNKPRIGFKPPK